MPKATNVLSQFLLSSEILIKNGRNVAVLSEVLREFGYDETRWAWIFGPWPGWPFTEAPPHLEMMGIRVR